MNASLATFALSPIAFPLIHARTTRCPTVSGQRAKGYEIIAELRDGYGKCAVMCIPCYVPLGLARNKLVPFQLAYCTRELTAVAATGIATRKFTFGRRTWLFQSYNVPGLMARRSFDNMRENRSFLSASSVMLKIRFCYY